MSHRIHFRLPHHRFGLVNVKFGVATIIKNFKATLDTSKVELPLRFNPQNANPEPVGGFHVKLERI